MLDAQLKLINDTKKFLNYFNKKSFKPYFNSIFYLATYINFIGSSILRFIGNENNNKFTNLTHVYKDILFGLNYTNYKIYHYKRIFKYDKIILTWAGKNNFDRKGILHDKFFNIRSDSLKKTLWFVVYLDKEFPKKIDENILIFKPLSNKWPNLLKFIQINIQNIYLILKNFKYFLASISNHNFFANIFLDTIKPFLNNKVKYLIMPYEGQPFQNRLVALIKKKNIKTVIIGYIHSPPLAMPTNFIYKKHSPDKIILNGIDQVYCFTKLLGWKKSKIKLLPSFRFKKNKINFRKKIFLPASVNNPSKIVDSLKFLNNQGYIDLKKYNTQNHPTAFAKKTNLTTIKLIEILKKNLKPTENKNKNNFSIFAGNSGGIIEALERGANVIQISEFSLFDTYSKKIWPSILSKKINKNIYFYKLKKKGNLIKFGHKHQKINRIFN